MKKKEKIKRLLEMVQILTFHMESDRLSGDAGNWELDEDSDYTKAINLVKQIKEDEL